jgi:hypothetical protein
MSDWKKGHLQVFNFLGRIVGAIFTLGGGVFIIYGVAGGGALFVISGLVVAVLGVVLICARPYSPDSN